jgi:hypothetical protein
MRHWPAVGAAWPAPGTATRDAGKSWSRACPNLIQPLRTLFEDLDGPALAEFLVGGVLKADLHPSGPHSLKWDMLRADDFVLPLGLRLALYAVPTS